MTNPTADENGQKFGLRVLTAEPTPLDWHDVGPAQRAITTDGRRCYVCTPETTGSPEPGYLTWTLSVYTPEGANAGSPNLGQWCQTLEACQQVAEQLETIQLVAEGWQQDSIKLGAHRRHHPDTDRDGITSSGGTQ